MAPWALGERLTTRTIVGLLLSCGGVIWLMRDRIGEDNQPASIVQTVLWSRGNRDVHGALRRTP